MTPLLAPLRICEAAMPRYLIDRIVAGLATGVVLGALWLIWQGVLLVARLFGYAGE